MKDAMDRDRLHGLHLTLVTPFNKEFEVDESSLRQLIDKVIEDGVHVLNYPLTAGEGAALTLEEHKRVIAIVADQVRGRVPFLAGAVRASTQESIQLARHAESVGADGVIAMSPFYFQLAQSEMIDHFRSVANATSLPVVIYNHPAAAKTSLTPESAQSLASVSNVVAFFPTNLDASQLYSYRLALKDKLLLIGGREEVLPMAKVLGFRAQSTSTFHFAPQFTSEIWKAVWNDDNETTDRIFRQLDNWRSVLRRKVSAGYFGAIAAYTKASLALTGHPVGNVRPPLQPLNKAELVELEQVLSQGMGIQTIPIREAEDALGLG